MTNTERTANQVPSLVAKSNAADNADVILWADPTTHRLLTSTSVSGGSLSNNNAAPGANNMGVLPAVANAAAPSWTEGNQVLLSTDLSGALRVTGSLSVGGTTDNSAYTAGTSTGTPAMGFYHSVIDTVTDGRAATVAITSKRAMMVNLQTSAGAETGIAALPLQVSLANTGANATAVKVDGSAVTQPVSGTVAVSGVPQIQGDVASGGSNGSTNPVKIGGVFNTTQPTVTTGQRVDLQATARGALIVATGTDALNVGTVTTVTTVSTVTNLAQMNGVALLMGNGATGTGSQRVTLASDNTAIAGWGHGATGSAVPSGAQYKGLIAKTANPSAATDGNLVGATADKLGRQVVVLGNVRDLKGNQVTTITSSTTETTVVTAVASTFLDVYGCIVENTSATGSKVTFKDSTAGTTQFEIYVPPTETRGFMLPSSDGFKQTTVNTSWTATCGASVASIVITMLYVKNI